MHGCGTAIVCIADKLEVLPAFLEAGAQQPGRVGREAKAQFVPDAGQIQRLERDSNCTVPHQTGFPAVSPPAIRSVPALPDSLPSNSVLIPMRNANVFGPTYRAVYFKP